MRIRSLGDHALRLERPSGVCARTLLARAKALPGVVDAIVTEHHLALVYDGSPTLRDEEMATLGAIDDGAGSAPATHVLTVVYDGVDLDEVAALASMSVDSLIEAHVAPTYEVAMLGFLPGFGYLRGLDPRLVVPRRSSPRARVAAGSVAIAGGYTGVYPLASPGGWHVIGRMVGPPMFDASFGARLATGDVVRFERLAP